MSKTLKILLVVFLITLIPFGYFYYRDLISTSQTNSLDGCTPYNLSWKRNEQKLHVYWQTRDKCLGYLRYGDDPQTLGSIAVATDRSVRKSSHEVMIEAVERGASYFATIYSGDKVYGQSGQPIVINVD